MLRHFLTGQWGEDITTTTMGTFVSKTYTYTIPADYNGVATNLGDMEVVVYMADGQQEIITGNKSSMTLVVPPGMSIADMTVTDNATAPSGYCDYNYTPSVLVENIDTVAIPSYEVSYTINNGQAVTQTINTPLPPGGTNVVNFPQITLGGGANAINYSSDFTTTNANLIDVNNANNSANGGTYYMLSPTATATTVTSDFQSEAVLAPAPTGAIAINPNNIRAYVVNSSISSSVTWNLGAHGNSDGCFRWDYYAIQSGSSEFVYDKVDLSNDATAVLTFSHAYAQYTSENDRLEVLVSTDCGQTWTTVFDKAGANLATRAAVNPARFYPQPSEWADNVISLDAYAGQSEVIVAFRGTSAYGNSLYVDDINVDGFASSTEDIADVADDVKLFPNPATDQFNVTFTLDQATKLSVSLVNAVGQEVQAISTQNFAAGQHNLDINTSNIAAGMYFVVLKGEEGTTSRRVIVTK